MNKENERIAIICGAVALTVIMAAACIVDMVNSASKRRIAEEAVKAGLEQDWTGKWVKDRSKSDPWRKD